MRKRHVLEISFHYSLNALVVQLQRHRGEEFFELWFRLEYMRSFRFVAQITTLDIYKNGWGFSGDPTDNVIDGGLQPWA